MLLFALLLSFVAIAIGLAWFLIAFDRGQKEPVGMLWVAVGLGLLGTVAAVLLESWLLPAGDPDPASGLNPIIVLAGGVGVIEEFCKFVPLAILLWPRWYFNEHTDGVIYFALAGVGFGLPENLLYTLEYGTKIGISRIIFTPIFHAAVTGIVGFFLARRKLAGISPWGVALPLAAAMLLHGLYDFGMLSHLVLWILVSIAISLCTSAGLFVIFQRATELDQDRGLSVVGVNNFCRSCGAPNPQHHLYCTQCGRNA